ncbi:MAG: formylglycine-generating enzyme family protein [Candidatus Delongbacteria bacterium]|nr:formylglycine-generating enzyme family protein [Candidatus Delongbacteria bacterium]MCG2760336.1 formylglycine-generating enzyme family protein [Candidatus Delongbacteria bacterium]
MKRSIIILMMIFLNCFAGKIHINFNDSTTSAEIDYSELRNIEFCDSSMVFVHGGSFEMGDHFSEGSKSELPVHSVTVSDFYISKTEVTWKDWRTVMDTFVGIGNQEGDAYPVNNINWYSTLVYCNKKSIMEGLEPCYTIYSSTNPDDWGEVPTEFDDPNIPDWDAVVCDWEANGYRLPTEAEWEYAARGGVHNVDDYRYSGCHNEIDLKDYAWYSANSDGIPHPVGTKLPNQLNIYNMNGNVSELCWDSFEPDYYSDCNDLGTVDNPTGSTDTTWGRITRGGTYYLLGSFYSRISYRCTDSPYMSMPYNGLRLVRKP